ncbi:MAG: hypothetical protein RSD85_01460 [Erysipelotrichaceae bacterium]
MNEKLLAKEILNAVWDENIAKANRAILNGANPNWIFNGYPLLLHAVFSENLEMVMFLIENGASQIDEALGFALDRCIGNMILPLSYLGVVPKIKDPLDIFGPYPSRYAPMKLCEQLHI